MPKPPRFTSPRAQQLAVGVVTFVAFGIAIALAQVYTQSQKVDFTVKLEKGKVDELSLPLPAGWERIDNVRYGIFSGNPQTFVDPAMKERKLTVARIDAPTVVTPDTVIKRLVVEFSNQRQSVPKTHTLEGFRGESSVGLFFRGLWQVDEARTTVCDWMVVLTEDGKRYWMIHLTMPLQPQEAAQRTNEAALLAIARAADDTAILNVTPDNPEGGFAPRP